MLVFDPQGRLLLQRRTDTSEWAIPGGMMEPGESFEQTARREILEETGLTLGALEFLGVYSGSQFYYRYPNGDEVNNVSVAYTPASALAHCAPTKKAARLVSTRSMPYPSLSFS